MQSLQLTLLLLSARFAYSAPTDLNSLAAQGSFTFDQVAVNRTARHSIRVVSEAYWKHGFDLPSDIDDAVQALELETVNKFVPPAGGDISTSVTAQSIRNDLQYLIEVKVGKHDLMLDLDTGSSDL